MSATYVIDTSVVVDLNHYQPRDVYQGPWRRLELLIDEERCCMPKFVYEELLRIDDHCAPWAKGIAGFVVEATDDEFAIVATITADHPAWVQEQKNAADPWIVARAAVLGGVILTHERMRGPGVTDVNLGIPNVAKEYGIDCIGFTDLARAEGWTF